MPKKLNYSLGDCFSIPLREGGYARGVVARMNGKGRVFGYFFGPTIESQEKLNVDKNIVPNNAILLGQFGDLGLLQGEWSVFAKIDGWSKDAWPLPEFIRCDEGDDVAILSQYDDSLHFCGERQVDISTIDVSRYPRDTVMGYGFVEIMLTKLLSEQ